MPSTHTPNTFRRSNGAATAAVLLAVLAGCANMDDRQRGTAGGAAIGAVTGAVISSATGGKAGTGAVVGGALGAVAGNIWSRRMEEKRQAMEQATQGTGVEVTRTADNQLKLDVPSDISFATNSAALEPRLRPVLDGFANGLSSGATTVVRVVGHTDNTGNDAINDPLSLRRAESVRNYLMDRGIRGDRVEVAGRGSREPLVANDTADNRARNRRVEIFLREPQGAGG
ncbi:Outer membrane protein OmpA [Roseateles sp. YR242]|uniref:OmpA family protein n=1 Tax=Roseateles sp. YR242 TaxID=1855305 RepID=UPI0008CA074B|nr:OmpA family protein [Roseateles sp. YR242]SEL06581.1 Outer membrane protein OmpA [Roseateles sp. YR242]